MKYLIIILLTVTIASATEENDQSIAFEEYVTRLVEAGIDAGVNACIVRGIPRNKYSLEFNKAHAKALLQAVYPDILWQWRDPQPIDPATVGKIQGEQVF